MKKIGFFTTFLALLFLTFSCKGTPKAAGEYDAMTLVYDIEIADDGSEMKSKEVSFNIPKKPAKKYDIWCMYTNVGEYGTSDVSQFDNINSPSDTPANTNVLYSGEIFDCYEPTCEYEPKMRDDSNNNSENVGDTRTFYRSTGDEDDDDGYVAKSDTLKLKRTVYVDSKGDKKTRTLKIWLEDGVDGDNVPTDAEFTKIADVFLKDGLNNDIYDKMTLYFGNDDGWLQEKYDNKFIPFNGDINLFYCNISDSGVIKDGASYEAGYYHELNNAKKLNSSEAAFSDAQYSNECSMICLHAYTSGGDFLGNGLLTLAHEFQHLLHAQYFNLYRFDNTQKSSSVFEYNDEYGDKKISYSIDECFSSMTEEYFAKYITDTVKKEARDPFYVIFKDKSNKINQTGFLTSDFVNKNEKVKYDSMGTSYLESYDDGSLDAWYVYGNEESDETFYGYGVVASLGHYLLCNYGMDVVKYYRELGGVKGNIDGLVEAINAINRKNNKKDDLTREKFLKDWGISVLLSRQRNFKKPHSFNKTGWIESSGNKIPSVNMWLYSSSSKKADNVTLGFRKNVGSEQLRAGVNTFKLVKPNVPAGVFTLDPCSFYGTTQIDKLRVTLVAVPVVD